MGLTLGVKNIANQDEIKDLFLSNGKRKESTCFRSNYKSNDRKIIDDRTATTEESSQPFARIGMDFKANRTKGSTEEIAFCKNLENLIAKTLVLPI